MADVVSLIPSDVSVASRLGIRPAAVQTVEVVDGTVLSSAGGPVEPAERGFYVHGLRRSVRFRIRRGSKGRVVVGSRYVRGCYSGVDGAGTCHGGSSIDLRGNCACEGYCLDSIGGA